MMLAIVILFSCALLVIIHGIYVGVRNARQNNKFDFKLVREKYSKDPPVNYRSLAAYRRERNKKLIHAINKQK